MMEQNQGERMKTRNRLFRLLSKVQDNGEAWHVEGNGCNRIDIVKNSCVVDFLIENGVGFVADINEGSK